jgi:NRPS condensation-like uncharacterized protein
MLDQKMDGFCPRVLDLVRWFSLARVDRLGSRTTKNYRTRKPLETATLSNLGRQDPAPLTCDGFTPTAMFVIPLKGSVFMTMVCLRDEVELGLNLPRVLASEGRMDAFIDFLRAKLAR